MIYGWNDSCLASRAYIFRQVIAYVNAYLSSKSKWAFIWSY